MRAHRVVMLKPGPPEVLRYEPCQVAAPGPGEALLRQGAVALNYIDVQHRTGRYKLLGYPSPIGMEAAGVVEAVGPGVTEVKPGDRVVYSSAPIGAYADLRVMTADRLVPLPEKISERLAASVFTKGLTAQYLLFTTYPVKRGDTILVHAAAGGVGLIVCEWAKYLGATVIGTVSTEVKARLAKAHGCDHAIVYTEEDFAAAVMRLTEGRGVAVVYDSVGADTFAKSLRCLAPRGILASFGTASGPVPPLDVFELNTLGSLYVTSPAFLTHTKNRRELLARAQRLFAAVEEGILKTKIGRAYPLVEAVRAHEDLQARRTTGASILIP